MKNKFLLISYNFHPELTGIGKYNGEMIRWLAEDGYDCTVLTAYPYYPHWEIQEPYHKKRFRYSTDHQQFNSGGRVVVHRCPMYVPTKPSGLKRIVLDFTFLVSAFFKLVQLLLNNRFDTVFVVAPSFHFGLLGVLCKKVKRAKFIYHIQDMQIEAARDLQMITSKIIINLLFKIEKYIFNKADILSTISDTMVRKVEEKAGKKALLFPNWVDTKLFYPIADRSSLKIQFGFNAADIIVLYSGAVGEKQGLEAILQAADTYKTNKDLKFVICGSGPYKIRLEKMAQELELHNVIFMPLQSLNKFNAFLNCADAHLVIQKADASDLVMPSKLTTILAIGGLALITANQGSGMYSLVKKHEIGLLIEAENQPALNAGIQVVLDQDNKIIAKNAQLYAKANLSIDFIMKQFERTLFASNVLLK
jgi:colanic acid biosynthesis glycosyl transferase WcaI